MKKKIILTSLLLSILTLCISDTYAQKSKAVNLILDTDIGPDYDDVGAMAVMHSLADSGQVNILATMASNQSKYIASVLNVINTYFKRPNIPVGVVRGRAVRLASWQKWDSILVAKYPHTIKNNDQKYLWYLLNSDFYIKPVKTLLTLAAIMPFKRSL